MTDRRDAQPLPFREQYLVKVVTEVVRHQGTRTDIGGESSVDLLWGFAVTFEDLAGVAVDPGRFRRDCNPMIE